MNSVYPRLALWQTHLHGYWFPDLILLSVSQNIEILCCREEGFMISSVKALGFLPGNPWTIFFFFVRVSPLHYFWSIPWFIWTRFLCHFRSLKREDKLRLCEHGTVSDLLNLTCFADIQAFPLSVETWSCLYMPAYLDGAGCKRERACGLPELQPSNALKKITGELSLCRSRGWEIQNSLPDL